MEHNEFQCVQEDERSSKWFTSLHKNSESELSNAEVYTFYSDHSMIDTSQKLLLIISATCEKHNY